METPRDRPVSPASDLGSVEDIDAMLERGVSVLRASGRLSYEAEGADHELVLQIVDAVMKAGPTPQVS